MTTKSPAVMRGFFYGMRVSGASGGSGGSGISWVADWLVGGLAEV